MTRYTLIALALAGSAGSVGAQRAQFARGGAVIVHPSIAYAATTLDGLAIRYRRLAATATAPYATTVERAELARFVRGEIVPRLKLDIVSLYVTFDSLVGGAYTVPATLFDLDAIDLVSKDVERSARFARREAFDARTYALSMLLEGYFAKTQLLVLPMVNDRLNGALLSVMPGSDEKTANVTQTPRD